ncbi:MAG TPA: hypothetical protein VEV17_13875 [Bryobacteraceae bacterium]|nr:hypothetical protein [Bryobacteraceae bacterium]
MKTNGKPEAAQANARPDSVVSQFSDWVQHGTENFFAAQRILLDLVMRQNAMAMNALRGRLASATPASAVLTDVAGEGFANFIAAQRILLKLSKHQNEIVMTGVKERVGAATPAAAMADLLRRSVDTFIDLQEHFLDTAAKQSEAWVESARTGRAFTGKGLGELAREGIENLVVTQKKLLDVIAEETAKATKEAKAAAKPVKKTDLAELTRHSVDAFIEAQKKLLETAGRQFEANMEAAGKAADVFAAAPGTTFGELTRQGVANFVAAQKALLDVMVKPRPVPAKGSAREHAGPAAQRARAR